MISAADEPVAVALQAAEWIRIVYAELEEWRTGADAHEAHATENHKFDRVAAELSGELEPHHHRISARAKSALFAIRDHNAPPTRKKLVALQPRYLDPKDIWAALAVIDWWNRALLVRLGRRQRLRSYVTDWTLIKMALLKHMPVRDVAVRVGLDASGSGVAQRIAEATADVAASVGDFALDFPAPRLQWSRPRLTPQIYKSACYNKGIDRKTVRNLDKRILRPWFSGDRSDQRLQYQSHDAKLIADFIERNGVTKCPPGLAEGYGVISIHGKAGDPDARIPVGDRKYDAKAGTVEVTIPPRAARIDQPFNPESFDKASFRWSSGDHDWKTNPHKQWCREGAFTKAEFDRVINPARALKIEGDPPKKNRPESPGVYDVLDRMNATTEGTDGADDAFFMHHDSNLNQEKTT